VRVKLIPTKEELDECRAFGRDIAGFLVGKNRNKGKVLEMAEL